MNALVVNPGGEVRIPHVVSRVEADQPNVGDRLQGGSDLGGLHARVIGEELDPDLLRLRDQATVVVSLSNHSDPQAELAVGELADLAVLKGLRLEGADPRHQLSPSLPAGAA